MDKIIRTSIQIDAPAEAVWKALTDKEIIKQYLFGTETTSDWEKGSAIKFTGSYNDMTYEDGGVILDIIPNEVLSYTYWSSMSGIEDKPENYAVVTYKIVTWEKGVELVLEQANTPTETMYNNSSQHWPMVLQQIKELVEG